MKRFFSYFGTFVFFLIYSWAYSSSLFAHGTDYRKIDDCKAVSAEFFYSDREPMRYAEVLVYGPKDEKLEYQNGRTDRNGRFSFYPDVPGTWRIEVNDGMGHLAKGDFAIKGTSLGAEPSTRHDEGLQGKTHGPGFPGQRVILGLSLILNIFFIAFRLKQRSGAEKK